MSQPLSLQSPAHSPLPKSDPASGRWRKRWPARSTAAGTSSCKRARARARRSATSYQRSWQANEWSSPRQRRRCRISWRRRTCRSWKRTWASRSTGRCSRGAATTCACSVCARSRGPTAASSSWRSSPQRPRWRSTGSSRGRAPPIPATRRGSTGHPAIEHGRRSASAATSAPAPPAARWDRCASPKPPALVPPWPTWWWSTCTSTGCTWAAAACCCPSTTWS